jgi:soluble lytic murein transglycosylase
VWLVLVCGIGAAAAGEVQSPDELVARLRDAKARIDAADHRRAAALLEGLAESELADHVGLLRARALVAVGDSSGADAAALRGLGAEPPRELRSRLEALRAELALARGDWPTAYREQREAWEATRDPERAAELAGTLARAFERAALPGDALRAYELAWQRWPLTRAGIAAWERGEFLAHATGAPANPPERVLERAERFREAFRCEPALASYDALLAATDLEPALRAQVELGRAHCLFQRRRYPEAEAAFGALAAARRDDPELAIMAARSRARRGDARAAAQALLALAPKAERSVRARARHLAAILLEDDDPAAARKLMERVERQTAEPALAGLARWRLAWEDYRAGRTAAAERRLAVLSRGRDNDVEVQRARYWAAQIQLGKDEQKGREALRAIATALPLSYYGLLAAEQLGESPALARAFVGERTPLTGRAATRARLLLDAGFTESARDELVSRALDPSLPREERAALSALLHEIGAHHRAVQLVVDAFSEDLERGVDPAWRDVWELAWPRPFASEVDAAVREFEFDGALVYAIMREESSYRPEVESPVGARGLMQLIEPTAERISRSLGEQSFSPDLLFLPEVSVRFGTYYLKQLLGEFGSRPLAIAAYNAGPEAVSSWLGRDGALRADHFVESVRYDETRRYLRRVLRSYRVYQLLYAGGPGSGGPAQPQVGARR